jgi:predicted metal-dependent hydrolase
LIESPARQLAFDFADPNGTARGRIPPAPPPVSRFSRDVPAQPSETAVMLFVRHPRARRYVLRVIDEHTVRVTLPRWGSKREAAAFVQRERRWIEKQRRRFQARTAHRPEPGRPTLPSPITSDSRFDAGQQELVAQARRVLPARVNELAALHGLTVTSVSIRNQRWRWGSCSRNGHICLNWRLVAMPDSVRDYVIIHELMHLKRLDHSKRFWTLVAAACPDYQSARRYLREHAMVLAAPSLLQIPHD